MNRPIDPDRTRLDLNPAEEVPPGTPLPPAAEHQPVVEQEMVGDPDHRRRRTVSIVCTVINVICAIFAVVLALHIILVFGNANQGNSFATLINDWSAAVSLGLRDLFVPDNLQFRTFLNDGLAAIVWLAIAALLTYLIRKFALPSPRRVSQYRRTWR
jgi:hypothetical protein